MARKSPPKPTPKPVAPVLPPTPKYPISMTLAQIYEAVYKEELNRLSPALQLRVMKVKDDNTIRDSDVNLFVASVCAKAESAYDANQEQLKNDAKPQCDLK
jgi:hypothetical protein